MALKSVVLTGTAPEKIDRKFAGSSLSAARPDGELTAVNAAKHITARNQTTAEREYRLSTFKVPAMMRAQSRTNLMLALATDPVRRRFVNDNAWFMKCRDVDSKKGSLCGIKELCVMAKLVFGCGYLGQRVALLWKQAGHEVFAVTRSSRRADELLAMGIRPVVGELTDGIVLPEMASLDTVLFAVGFDASAGRTIHEVYVHGLHNALNALPDSLQKFIYISSTGVYGQTAGELVDEESPCDPARAGGIACLAAERLLREHRLSSRGIILRLAGLYGPGRIPKLESLRSGTSLAVASSGYLNLIHIDDAAQVVLAAETRAPLPSCYVVSDGCPVKRREFYQEAARLAGTPLPRFEEPAPGTSASARATSSKRLVTARLQRDLAVGMQFPTFREGLASIVGRR